MLPHNITAENLFFRLRQLLDALRSGSADRELGNVHHEMGYRLGRKPDSWLIPDVSITHYGQPSDGGFYEDAPLIAIEVISESNTAAKIDRKIEKYLANGSQEV
jgi:Uma2 family endonuclease